VGARFREVRLAEVRVCEVVGEIELADVGGVGERLWESARGSWVVGNSRVVLTRFGRVLQARRRGGEAATSRFESSVDFVDFTILVGLPMIRI